MKKFCMYVLAALLTMAPASLAFAENGFYDNDRNQVNANCLDDSCNPSLSNEGTQTQTGINALENSTDVEVSNEILNLAVSRQEQTQVGINAQHQEGYNAQEAFSASSSESEVKFSGNSFNSIDNSSFSSQAGNVIEIHNSADAD